MYIVEMYILCVEIAFSNNLRNQSALYRIACENESFLLDVSFCLHICREEPGGRAVAEQDHGSSRICVGAVAARSRRRSSAGAKPAQPGAAEPPQGHGAEICWLQVGLWAGNGSTCYVKPSMCGSTK